MTAYEIWRSGPRHEDYEEWVQNVIPRIMEENTKLHKAAKWLITALAGCSVDNDENGEWQKQDIANLYKYACNKWPELKP